MFENDQLKLMPGLTANVKILVASASNVMKVSNMALRFQPPADIIDTTGVGSVRNGFMGRGENITDSSKSGLPSLAKDNKLSDNQKSFGQNGQNEGAGQYANFQPSATDIARFRAIRDSLQSAHGGKLSPEDLRNEMQKMFAKRAAQKKVQANFK